MTAGKRGSAAAGQSAPSGHGLARGRVRLGLVTVMIGLGAIWDWELLQSQLALATIPVREITAQSLVNRVRWARGQVLILSLYRADSEDPQVVGDLRRWATQTTPPVVRVVAVAVGTRRDAQLLFRDSEDRGVQRLPPEWLGEWQPADLDAAMAELGIRASGERSFPLTAVFDPEGRVIAQWQGSLDYLPVLAAAKTARLAAKAATQR